MKRLVVSAAVKRGLLACLAGLLLARVAGAQTVPPDMPPPAPVHGPDMPPPAPVPGPASASPFAPAGPAPAAGSASPFAPAPQALQPRRQRATAEPGQRGRLLDRLRARFQGLRPQRGRP